MTFSYMAKNLSQLPAHALHNHLTRLPITCLPLGPSFLKGKFYRCVKLKRYLVKPIFFRFRQFNVFDTRDRPNIVFSNYGVYTLKAQENIKSSGTIRKFLVGFY